MMMAARPPGSHRTAKVLRQQVVRSDFRRAVETARPSEADKDLPEMLRDLLQKLEDAEKKRGR